MAPPAARRASVKSSKTTEACKADGKPCDTRKPGDGLDPAGSTKKRILPGPTQSPRDPNLYRVLRLYNGMLVGLSSTCGFSEDEMRPCESPSAGRIKSGTRSKCKRTRSDFETPKSKIARSRPKKESVVKDLNCVDKKVGEFNKEVLHICESEAECPQPTGFLDWALVCCSQSASPDMVDETAGDQTNDDPANGTPEDGRRESTWSSMSGDAEQEEIKRNLWSRADRLENEDEDEEEPKIVDCSRGRGNAYSVCSVAITLPWGQIFESDEAPGVSELCRTCIQGCDYAYPYRQEENTTFVAYVSHNRDKGNLADAIKCMAEKFYPPTFEKPCVDKALKRIDDVGSFADRQKNACWGKGYENLLMSPKRIKLLSTLTKLEHPIRRCALGGKSNKRIQDINRSSVERAMNEYLRNGCRPQYMTVAVEGPESLDSLEELVLPSFGKVGSLGSTKPPEVHKVDGEDDPFDTIEFRKLYKVLPCPQKCEEKCSGQWIFLSFPLPPEALKNYKTQPLTYLSHIVGHKGTGGLNDYLAVKNWVKSLHAECSPTQFHRNQFGALFEISMLLTNEGFDQRLEVLQATFAYLRMLSAKGPQKRIFKELQKIQSIGFHSLGKSLDDLHMTRDARHLSQGLQNARSEDMITAGSVMTAYNGPLLSQLLNLLTPDTCNIMIVSNAFEDEEIDKEEPFLMTKYGVQDIPPEWMSAFKNGPAIPELTLPGPNPFIPDYFCIVERDDSTPKLPSHLSGSEYHDLWHLSDPRYKTQAAAVIHFVTPLAMIDLESATLSSFFYKMFKTLLRPTLYPAELAYTEYTIERTDFGIMVRVQSNADKLTAVIDAMCSRLHIIQDLITPEFFENQKTLFRKKICCEAKNSASYASWLHTETVLLNASCPTDYLPILDKLTLEEMKMFIDAVKKDLFLMLLVVGNATDQNAKDLCESMLQHMDRTSDGKAIERVEVLQWPVGERVIRVKGHGHGPTTHVSNFYQLGIADSKTFLMASLIEPVLQGYFLKNVKLMGQGIFVMVGTQHVHNVLELQFRVNVPEDMTPEDVNDLIEDELEEFYSNRICPLKQKELEEMKKFYLCGCEPNCAWFTAVSNLSILSQGVRNLNMSSVGVEVQKQPCECLKPKDVQEWFQKFFMDNTGDKDVTAANMPERRKMTIIVMKEPAKKELPVDSAVHKTSTAGQQKKKNKKKGSPCGKEQCPSLDFKVDIPGEQEGEEDEEDKCEKNTKGKGKSKVKKQEEATFDYIRNVDYFKKNCFIYPSYIPRN